MRIILLISFFFSFNIAAQDLFKQRIRKISARKKSIFLDSGIFHNGAVKRVSTLKKIRHSFTKSTNVERIVFDFDIKKVPKIYGQIDYTKNRIRVDLFDTDLGKAVASFGDSRLVKNIDFFPLTNGMLSVELTFKSKVSADIFYLESPGRLVIDVKI